MFRPSATILTVAGASLFLTTLAHSALTSPPSRPGPQAAGPEVARALKADPVAAVRPTAQPRRVTTIEVVGVSDAVVILRSRDGAVLYRADAGSNTTLVTRDADLPVITVRQREGSPTVERDPAAVPAPASPAPGELRPAIAGCEGAVSVLANRALSRKASLCLADAGQAPRG